MSKSTDSKLKELLDRLQVESWQLELLVSGFAIFLVGSSFEPIINFGSRLFVISDGINANFSFLAIFAVLLLGSVSFIFINLVLHIIFRGLWISAIGLRSISGEIDFEVLNFTKPFDHFMRRKLKSFDHFIERLEDISSVIFAFTFLIVFMMISMGLFFFFLGFVAYFINKLDGLDHSEVYKSIGIGVLVLLIVSSFFYFLDFITLGFFKRKRWIAIWYYPIYRFYSIITFSWLYRPLYYNLIDNKFGRRVGAFLVPYFIIISIIASINATINLYIPEDAEGYEITNKYFENTREKDKRISQISIPSKFIKNGFLELFIKYDARNEDNVIEKICPTITPDKTPGFNASIAVFESSEAPTPSPPDSLLMCVSQVYQVSINDSLFQDLDYYFYINPAYEEEGLKTIIDVQPLGRGKHTLKIDRLKYNAKKDTLIFNQYVTTPFWIE